jgi:hypothetical protein
MCGVQGAAQDRRLTAMRLYDLRHTTATLLLGQSVHPRVVMETLGHSQVSLTLDSYSHVLLSLQEEAARSIDAAIGCQDDQSAADQREEIEDSLGILVSRVGIEPTTRRLRAASSDRDLADFRTISRTRFAESGIARQIAATPARPDSHRGVSSTPQRRIVRQQDTVCCGFASRGGAALAGWAPLIEALVLFRSLGRPVDRPMCGL